MQRANPSYRGFDREPTGTFAGTLRREEAGLIEEVVAHECRKQEISDEIESRIEGDSFLQTQVQQHRYAGAAVRVTEGHRRTLNAVQSDKHSHVS